MQWWPFAIRSRMELQFHPIPGSKRSSKLHKMYQSRCTAKNSWWWAGKLPETCRVVIPIKLDFSASVGFIPKESVTMYGHTIIKSLFYRFIVCNTTGWITWRKTRDASRAPVEDDVSQWRPEIRLSLGHPACGSFSAHISWTYVWRCKYLRHQISKE